MIQDSKFEFYANAKNQQNNVFENTGRRVNIPFEIHTLTWAEQNGLIENDVPVHLQHFGIIWIKKGKGLIKLDLEEYSISDNMMVCLSLGQLLSIRNTVDLEGYYVSFSAEFLLMTEGQTNASFLDTIYEKRSLPIIFPDEEMRHEMEAIAKMLHKEFNNYGILRLQILKGLLKMFIIYLTRNLEINERQNLQDRDTEMVRKFMALIKKHFLVMKMVADYASELCVSANYLNRVVKKISGFTASYHIQQQIILEAKRQAIYSSLSMKEVAYFLGFNDYAHFSKFFKNNSGMNFTCFKNQLSNRA